MKPEDVLSYWLDEVGPDGWYKGGDALDKEVASKFQDTWEKAGEGALSLWLTYPSGALAYIILTDQFPRNMFRGTAKAFATDAVALAAAKSAIARGWDMKIDEPARQFFYMPLMHSECLVDQDRCVRLMLTRMPNSEPDHLLHAKVHREVIRRFGRFPYRNDALSRKPQGDELDFIANGGYAHALQTMQGARPHV
ncbi:DUF924 family protein [Ovoidimarina sediminis]|uniref:DUF924 family protein n=1 Tax=Ovoidimarina sediminis TaxID=3079856 RepID=UPI0029136834|nr:DUF924 family protein [Rhodophyticola sp. MJ-SS7]MDU8945042.1 DUF924 family protein [Rhodophyticola sp. MJ-SS7]